MLGLAGCGNAKTVSYDKDTLIQSCDAVFDIIESGSITSDQITEMSDWNQGYLMAQFESQTGVQMEADMAAKIMYTDADADTLKAKTEEYKALQSSPLSAAGRGYVDTIIEPADTRKYVIGAFEMLFTKREERPSKKHGTI